VRGGYTYSVGTLRKSYPKSLGNPCCSTQVLLRPTVSRPGYLGVRHRTGKHDSCGFFYMGRPLLRGNASVVYSCCWASAVQSFSDPSPVGLMAIFYCLKLETLENTCQSQSQSPVTTDGQSVSMSRCRAPSGSHDRMFVTVWPLLSRLCGPSSLTRSRLPVGGGIRDWM
jgi:hypothetical protein